MQKNDKILPVKIKTTFDYAVIMFGFTGTWHSYTIQWHLTLLELSFQIFSCLVIDSCVVHFSHNML